MVGELDFPLRPLTVCRGQRGPASILLDGADERPDGWGRLLGLGPRVLLSSRVAEGRGHAALGSLERIVRARRRRGGTSRTGVAALLGFELLGPERRSGEGLRALPDLVVLGVDAAVAFHRQGPPVLAAAPGAGDPHASWRRWRDRLAKGSPQRAGPTDLERPGITGAPTTSLPRADYLRAVERVKAHLRAGDVYQANLTQRFTAPYRGDALDVYAHLAASAPAPRAAFVEAPGLAVASISPETFLRVDREGGIETRPIKGTRPRGDTEAQDAALARELLGSAKDRAELMMIVDLERNDLGRVCRVGSVHVPAPPGLRSFPTVHHLEAAVRGTLRSDVGPRELIESTFPGGSVTGAPKRRALEILRDLEPVPRGFYTGSLFWFGDDGSVESSILIRTLVLAGGRVYLGAGGGIVADSDPEEEWRESNHKARRLAEVLGFAPEEAISRSPAALPGSTVRSSRPTRPRYP